MHVGPAGGKTTDNEVKLPKTDMATHTILFPPVSL